MSKWIDGDALADSIHTRLCEELSCKECSMRLADGGCKVEKWLDEADTPQTEDEYFLELMGAVKRGEMSDAEANQAWCEYINKQTEMSDTPQTNCSEKPNNSDCPWK